MMLALTRIVAVEELRSGQILNIVDCEDRTDILKRERGVEDISKVIYWKIQLLLLR